MTKGKKILFIVPHRLDRSPGQRFRFEQYIDVLEKAGYEITISNLLDEKDDATFYSSAKYFQKGIIVLKSLWKRYSDILRAGKYDIVFIYREAIMLGFTWFEENLAKSKAKLILDFDDAIWLKDVSEGNRNLAFLKKPGKTFKIVQLADLIIAGNRFIADTCSKYNNNIQVFPTTIDTDYHVPGRSASKDKICIGWTGTETTLKHLETAMPALEKIYSIYKAKIYFKFICDKQLEYPSLNTKTISWSRSNEIEQLNEFDIGIMPLPENEWTRAKCGFKALQYLALEIPAIVSPVGVNNDIIDHGVNGFQADNLDEWVQYLEILINSAEMREQFGKEGRQKIISTYSKKTWSGKYVRLFDDCFSNHASYQEV